MDGPFAVPEFDFRSWVLQQGGSSMAAQSSSNATVIASTPPLAPIQYRTPPAPTVQRNFALLERLRMSDDELRQTILAESHNMDFTEAGCPTAESAWCRSPPTGGGEISPDGSSPRASLHISPTPRIDTRTSLLPSMSGVVSPSAISSESMNRPISPSLPSFVALERLAHVSELESALRRAIVYEEDSIRSRVFEMPSLRRTAQYTVAKLEKLFLKQEKALRESNEKRKQIEIAATSVRGEQRVKVSNPISDALLEEVAQLAQEIRNVVLPSLVSCLPSAPATSSSDNEELKALTSVVQLLADELAKCQEAMRDVFTPVKHSNQPPLPPPRHAAVSRDTHQQQRLILALVDQNTVLLEGLQACEEQGFVVPSAIMQRLHALSSV